MSSGINALPKADIITFERNAGSTRASITLASSVIVSGAWAAGDQQALRRLVEVLVEVTEGATARLDRAQRLVVDLSAGTRILRDQLRTALDDVDHLHSEQEATRQDAAHRQGELLAEITALRAQLGTPTPTLSVDQATLTQLRSECHRLREAFATEKRRADTAVVNQRLLQEQLLAAQDKLSKNVGPDFARRNALEATKAAEEAFETASWKEGARYLKLANTWIALLNAGVFSEVISR